MFGVFKKHRILKLIGLTFGLFLLWYLVSPAIDMIRGQDVQITELVGTYAYGTDHVVEFYTETIGKMVSEGVPTEFMYTFDKGIISCHSVGDDPQEWEMRTLSNGAIFNCYDSTYLFKRN